MCKVWNCSHIPFQRNNARKDSGPKFHSAHLKLMTLSSHASQESYYFVRLNYNLQQSVKEVRWMSELFSPPFSGEGCQIQLITTADKTGNDSDVNRGSAFAEFSSSSSFCIQFLTHSWEEFISAIAFMMNSLGDVKANPNVV